MRLLFWGMVTLFLTSGCDSDRFLGYNYEARKVAQSLKITGRISDSRTGAGVPRALINIGGQTASCDFAGNFSFNYLTTEDVGLGQTQPLVVSSEKYFSHVAELTLYPDANNLNIALEYAAPIVLASGHAGGEVWANVRDYQGVDNLSTVQVSAYYYNPGTRQTREFFFPMVRDQILDGETARYTGTLPESVEDQTWGLITAFYFINPRDKDGFTDRFRYQF